MARALWSGLLARTPADAQWRTRVEGALARVKQIETMERQNGRPGAEMPSNE
jgi:cytochrome c-type biogenesis protein CcmH/NrfG